MSNDVYKEREDILKRVIEVIIMPRYPEIKSVSVVSYFVGAVRRYRVYFDVEDISTERARKIEDDIKNLFIMCGLNANNRQNGRDFVDVYTF